MVFNNDLLLVSMSGFYSTANKPLTDPTWALSMHPRSEMICLSAFPKF